MTGYLPDSPVEYLPPPPTVPPAHPGVGEPVQAPPESYAPDRQWTVIGAAADVIDTGRPTGRWWRRLMPRTLTARLVTGVVALVVVLVLATSICTYVALRSFLFTRLDQQLDSSASPTGLQQLFGARTAPTPAGVHAPQRIWAVAILSSGAATMPPPNSSVEPLQLDAATRQHLFATPSSVTKSIDTQDGEHLRITTRHGTLTNTLTGQQIAFVAVVGLSTGEVDRTLGRLVELELIIGLSAIALALAATGYGVRYSLRRLRTVSTTAREVAAELSPTGAGLERRVDVDQPETEVGQLAESMNTLLSAVETQFAERVASEERMRQFLADASHELRTPLTSIRGYAELARMQGRAGHPASQDTTHDNLARIEAEGTRMSRLVDDLLTLARTDQGGERRSEVLEVAT